MEWRRTAPQPPLKHLFFHVLLSFIESFGAPLDLFVERMGRTEINYSALIEGYLHLVICRDSRHRNLS